MESTDDSTTVLSNRTPHRWDTHAPREKTKPSESDRKPRIDHPALESGEEKIRRDAAKEPAKEQERHIVHLQKGLAHPKKQ